MRKTRMISVLEVHVLHWPHVGFDATGNELDDVHEDCVFNLCSKFSSIGDLLVSSVVPESFHGQDRGNSIPVEPAFDCAELCQKGKNKSTAVA